MVQQCYQPAPVMHPYQYTTVPSAAHTSGVPVGSGLQRTSICSWQQPRHPMSHPMAHPNYQQALVMYPYSQCPVASTVDGSSKLIPIWQYYPPPPPMSHTMARQLSPQAQSMDLSYQNTTNPQMQQLYSGGMTLSRQELVNTSIRDHLRVTLKPHQEEALNWLSWREEQHPCGGILADEPGLGRIETMISLVLLKKLEAENTFIRCSLVICPASLIDQWAADVERCSKPGQLNIYLYRGPNRERRPEELAKYDMVFTSYRTVWTDFKSVREAAMGYQPALLGVFWDRIILDEAHNIKNPETETANLICLLRARARWVVIAYPIQMSILEMFSFFRFLRFTPYAEEWKKLVTNTETLHTLVKCILWRTSDQQTSYGNPIVSLPEKKRYMYTHEIYLSSEERKIYDLLNQQYSSTPKTVVIQQILMQCCCHLSLLGVLMDGIKRDPITGQVQPNMIYYLPNFVSTKIKFVIDRLMEIRAAGPADRPMKSVLVSKWTGMLDVVASHLSRAGFQYWSIRGAVSPKKRHVAMMDFNINPQGPEVMLVSLQAGRVGLNLIGGNHLFFLDMHWNPALEDIVCDSIWRVGQTRSVHIHKFVCVDTFEEIILEKQDKKRQLAKDVLTGSFGQADLELVMGDPYQHEA